MLRRRLHVCGVIAATAIIAGATLMHLARVEGAPAAQQTGTATTVPSPTAAPATQTPIPPTGTATATATATSSPTATRTTTSTVTATPATPSPTPTPVAGTSGGDGPSAWVWIVLAIAAVIAAVAGAAFFVTRRRQREVASTWVSDATEVYGNAAALRDGISVQLASEQASGAVVDLSQAEENASDVNAQLRRLEVAPPDDAKRLALAGVIDALDALRTSMSLHSGGSVALDVVRQRLTEYAATLATLRNELGGSA